jgi:hypothetical protein
MMEGQFNTAIAAAREIEKMKKVAQSFTDEWKMGNNSAAKVIEVAALMAEGELAYHQAVTAIRTRRTPAKNK